MNYLLLFYICGIVAEFMKTTKQLMMLEEDSEFLTKELKLNKIELFIAVLIISIIWPVAELYVFCETREIKLIRKEVKEERK